MESWGANVVDFDRVGLKNRLQAVNGAIYRGVKNRLMHTDVYVGFVNKATGVVIGDVQELYDAVYPGGDVMNAGGGAAQANWFINNTPVDLGCGGVAALTVDQRRFLMENCLGHVFTNVWLNGLLYNEIVDTDKDEYAKKNGACLEYFDRKALYDMIVCWVRLYLTSRGIGDVVFDEGAFRSALSNVGFRVVGTNVDGA